MRSGHSTLPWMRPSHEARSASPGSVLPPSPAFPSSPCRPLAPASGGESRASGLRRTPQPLGMLRGGTRSVAATGEGASSFPQGGGARSDSSCASAPHTFGGSED